MSSLNLFILLSLCLFALIVAYDDEEQIARLIVFKKSLTEPVVIGKPFIVNYNIKNVGNGVARSVEFSDRYGVDSFELSSDFNDQGIIYKKFDEIDAGSFKEFNLTVVPKVVGMFESTRALIRYKPEIEIDFDESQEEDDQSNYKIGYSSSLGKVQIFSESDAKLYKKTSTDAESKLSFGNYGVFFIVFGSLYYAVNKFLEKNKLVSKNQNKPKRG